MTRRDIAPVHPGVYLKELLDELNLSQYRLARELGVPAMRINHLVKGRRSLTAELALRLGRYFGQSPRYWMRTCRAGMIWMWLKIRYPSAWHAKCDPSRTAV